MIPAPSALILVGILKQPRDLEIARLLGWYRIPIRSAPKVISVDYMAFYQTGAFKEHRWRIQYLAPVRGHELCMRIELFRDEPEHPHAKHEYYKIQLGTLIDLPHPILAERWRRITFFYTTGEYFTKANTISDLILKDDERRGLWQALRERAQSEQKYGLEELPDVKLDPNIISHLLGMGSKNK